MIDKQGRLFGKVNLLDLVVLLAVLAVVGRYGYQHFKPKPVATGTTVNVVVKLAKVTQPTVDAIKVNDKVWDGTTNALLGTVIKKEAQPSLIEGATGEYQSKEDFDLYLTISGTGTVSGDGTPSLGGQAMKIGRAQPITTPKWAGTGFITDTGSK